MPGLDASNAWAERGPIATTAFTKENTMTNHRIPSQLISTQLAPRTPHRNGKAPSHRLPVCTETGLPRYRDRHQARDAAHSITMCSPRFRAHTYPCLDCRGFHIEKSPVLYSNLTDAPRKSSVIAAAPQSSSRRRYVLVDIENLTQGAQASCAEVGQLWATLQNKALGITHRDHVVVGAALGVHRKYRTAIHSAQTKWVVGTAGPDGADRALIAAIDIARVAREFDELVIASGDHAFAELAGRALQLGMRVHVVYAENRGQRTALAGQLFELADTRTLIRSDLRIHTQSKRDANSVTARWLRCIHAASANKIDLGSNYAAA